MLRVPVDQLQHGMILARPIPQPQDPARYLLQRDREVPLDLAPRLRQLGVNEVWIRYPGLEFLEELISEELADRQREVYRHVRVNFERAMSGATLELDIGSFQSAIGDLFEYLRRAPESVVLLDKLVSLDNYLMSHSTNVCYVSMLLGLKLENYVIAERALKSPAAAKDLQLLGLGCLLHDVGKLKIPSEILNKPMSLTSDEMQIMELHTVYGYEMVRKSVAPMAAQIVLNHHQRYNGKGYPARVDAKTGAALAPLAGKQIPVFSRIAAMADVYDAATTRRVYSHAKPAVQVLHEIRHCCQGFFDPVVQQAFYQIVPPFPIGKQVRLSDGAEAVVIDFDAGRPFTPKVRLIRDAYGAPTNAGEDSTEIDLALADELSIVEIDGHDTRPYMTPHEAVVV